MKYRLERGAEWVTLQRFGRVVTIERSDGSSVDHGHFDDAAADEALQVHVDASLSEGFIESAELLAKRQAIRESAERAATMLARHQAYAAAADPRAAWRELAGEWFAGNAADVSALLEHVVRIDEVTAYEVRIVLRGGGAILWNRDLDAPLISLWVFSDARALENSDHSVFFGDDAGPPEPPEELEGVDWFVQRLPHDHYWFTRADAPDAAHLYAFDGGVKADGRSRRDVLVSVVLHALRKV